MWTKDKSVNDFLSLDSLWWRHIYDEKFTFFVSNVWTSLVFSFLWALKTDFLILLHPGLWRDSGVTSTSSREICTRSCILTFALLVLHDLYCLKKKGKKIEETENKDFCQCKILHLQFTRFFFGATGGLEPFFFWYWQHLNELSLSLYIYMYISSSRITQLASTFVITMFFYDCTIGLNFCYNLLRWSIMIGGQSLTYTYR